MKKVLVIDDNDLIAKLLKEALSASGYAVTLAMDANDGYSAAIELQPDLILLDVQLPDVMGHDLIRIIKNREELADVPIIMITGTHHKTEHKVMAFKAGADDYVLKPFEMPELMERVAAVLRRSVKNGSKAVRPSEKTAEPPDVKPHVPPPMGQLSATRKFSQTPAASAEKTTPPAAAAPPPRPKPLTLPNALKTLLLHPEEFPTQTAYPPASMAFLLSALALGFVGLALSSGPSIKPAVFALVLSLSWVLLVSVLVMSSSVIGLALPWKEGARLFSLAMTPLLLKLAGGMVSSLWTSLSPFYFNAGPAVFFKTPGFWFERFDIFEIWSVALLWWLMKHRPASTPKRAAITSGLVWLTAVALAAAVQKLGN